MKQKLNYNLNWSECFQLDEKSPSGIVRIRGYSGKPAQRYTFGHQHFYQNGNPHAWVIGFRSKDYYIHRIIWVMIHGSIDEDLVIDHLDGNPFNNNIENLSLKTQGNNSRNQRKSRSNKTGVTGVRLVVVRAKYRYYEASWYDIEGKYRYKHFSVLKFGEETAKFLAISHRAEQIKHLIIKGADYTHRHGT